jgi:hypothetical protein
MGWTATARRYVEGERARPYIEGEGAMCRAALSKGRGSGPPQPRATRALRPAYQEGAMKSVR